VFGGSFDGDDALFKFIYQKDRLELEQQQHRLKHMSFAAIGGSFFMSKPDNRSGYLMGGVLGILALHFDQQASVISNAYDQYTEAKLKNPTISPKPNLLGIQENYRSLRHNIAFGLAISAVMSFKNESYDQQMSRQLFTLGVASGMFAFEFPVERMIREHYQPNVMRVQLIQGVHATKINLAMMI
jgi:hypothetical protein